MNVNSSARGFAVFGKSGPKLLLGLSIVSIYTLMVLGNVVTTTGSGLACPDWPFCHGTVNPPKEFSIWIEWSHRLLGGLSGILIILSAVVVWKKATVVVRFFIKLALGLISVGAMLGGVVVLIEAPLLDSAFHVAVISSHIVVSTVIFTSMILAFYAVSSSKGIFRRDHALSLFGLVYFQVLLGIIIRYSDASLACPDFPLCQGSILPPNYSLEVLLHYTHRIVALTIFSLTLWQLIRSIKEGSGGAKAGVTFGLVCLQGILGILIIETSMFLPVVVLHGAVGFLFLGWVAYRSAPYLIPLIALVALGAPVALGVPVEPVKEE